jgi:peptidoglycan/LPS O-acetylase OafA/YrhL
MIPGTHGGQPKRLLDYQPTLDGLRALAVAAVIVYHANKSWLGGGFLGVEVFFVISGYLITLLLIAEAQQSGRISLRDFWLRRGRRLLPALWLMLLAVTVYCALFHRETLGTLRGELVAALVYGFNWFQIWVGTSYFTAFDFVPLRHLWSLAVEEQFYVFWPIVMLVALKFGRRRLPIVGVAFAASAVVIAIWMATTYRSGQIATIGETPEQFMALFGHPVARIDLLFLGTISRAGGLLLGAALAIFWRPWLLETSPIGARGRMFDGVFVTGMAVLALCAVFFRDVVDKIDIGTTGYDPLFRGGFFLVGVASVLAIAGAIHPTAVLPRALLANRVMTYVGQRSYGLYLYHWPVFQFYRRFAGRGLTPYEFVVLVLLALALTELSYRYVETPIRRGEFGAIVRRWRESMRSSSRGVAVTFAAAALPVFALVSVATASVQLNDISQSLQDAQGSVVDVLGGQSGAEPDTSPGATIIAGTPVTPTTSLDGQVIDILAIGDSVMLGAAPKLTERGVTVDAMKSRPVRQALEIVNYMKSVGRLGPIVIIHLGTNNSTTTEVMDEIMAPLADTPLVLFLTVHVPSEPRQTRNNEIIRALADRYSNVKILDWYEVARQHPEYLYSDRTHLNPVGQQAYTDLVVQAIGRP